MQSMFARSYRLSSENHAWSYAMDMEMEGVLLPHPSAGVARKTTFMDLPVEVQEMIIDFCIPDQILLQHHGPKGLESALPTRVAIMRANRSINAVANATLYRKSFIKLFFSGRKHDTCAKILGIPSGRVFAPSEPVCNCLCDYDISPALQAGRRDKPLTRTQSPALHLQQTHMPRRVFCRFRHFRIGVGIVGGSACQTLSQLKDLLDALAHVNEVHFIDLHIHIRAGPGQDLRHISESTKRTLEPLRQLSNVDAIRIGGMVGARMRRTQEVVRREATLSLLVKKLLADTTSKYVKKS